MKQEFPLKYLYLFSNSSYDLIEVKQFDQGEESSPEKLYKWLLYYRGSDKIVEFDFQDMSSDGKYEYRQFVNADLSFNKTKASLSLFKEQINLELLSIEKLVECTQVSISNYYSLINNLREYDQPNYHYRPIKFSDLDHFYRWINDDEVIRYSLTKFHTIKSKDQITDWFLSMISNSNSFTIGIENLQGNLIGHVGISGINNVDKNGEYFIFIGDKNYWGKGIASQATKDMVRLGFEKLDLHRIFLTASSNNKGALRAYKKAGFIEEGEMREAFCRNNQYSNKVFMGILKDEWNAFKA